MKKVSIKYKASDIRGKTVFITSEIEVPDFKPMKEDIGAFISSIEGSETWSTERIKSFKSVTQDLELHLPKVSFKQK